MHAHPILFIYGVVLVNPLNSESTGVSPYKESGNSLPSSTPSEWNSVQADQVQAKTKTRDFFNYMGCFFVLFFSPKFTLSHLIRKCFLENLES